MHTCIAVYFASCSPKEVVIACGKHRYDSLNPVRCSVRLTSAWMSVAEGSLLTALMDCSSAVRSLQRQWYCACVGHLRMSASIRIGGIVLVITTPRVCAPAACPRTRAEVLKLCSGVVTMHAVPWNLSMIVVFQSSARLQLLLHQRPIWPCDLSLGRRPVRRMCGRRWSLVPWKSSMFVAMVLSLSSGPCTCMNQQISSPTQTLRGGS